MSNYRHPVAHCDHLNKMQNTKCVYMEIWKMEGGGHSVTFNDVMMMILSNSTCRIKAVTH